MSGINTYKLKSAIWITLLCLFIGAVIFGLVRVIVTVTWTGRSKDFRREIAADVEYAEANNSMYITVDGSEPVHIRFSDVSGIHTYLVMTPTALPASRSKAKDAHAVIDFGDGAAAEVWDAGERTMRMSYTSPAGKTYKYTLKYHTEYDGWDFFESIVNGESRPG